MTETINIKAGNINPAPAPASSSSNTDLSNLSNTGEAKIKSNIQLVNEVPAQPETGVLYVIPES